MCDLCSSPHIVRIMIYRAQQCAGHVARIGCTLINTEFLWADLLQMTTWKAKEMAVSRLWVQE